MIALTTTQFRSALDCAVEDHAATYDLTGHPEDEAGDQVAVADWRGPSVPLTDGRALPGFTWLRCVVTSAGDVRHFITHAAPIDVRVAAGLQNSAI